MTVSLAPRIASQGASVFVIAVTNTGPPCTLFKIHPLVWVWSVPLGKPVQTLASEATAGAPPLVMAANETKYAAVNLWPHFAPNGGADPTYLAVIANPVPGGSGLADERDLWLPASTKIDTSGASLGPYKATPAEAIVGV